jgi:hypothetical protein
MPYLAAGVLTLGFLYLLARAYTRLDPAAIVRGVRYLLG